MCLEMLAGQALISPSPTDNYEEPFFLSFFFGHDNLGGLLFGYVVDGQNRLVNFSKKACLR
jgi:hypothetical protein